MQNIPGTHGLRRHVGVNKASQVQQGVGVQGELVSDEAIRDL